MPDRLIGVLLIALFFSGLYWWGGCLLHRRADPSARSTVRMPWPVRLFAGTFRSDHLLSLWGLGVQILAVLLFLGLWSYFTGPVLGQSRTFWANLNFLLDVPFGLALMWWVRSNRQSNSHYMSGLEGDISIRLATIISTRGISGVEITKANITSLLALELTPPDVAFIAMEYWAGILNRTYLILGTGELLRGIQVHGIAMAPLTSHGMRQWLDLRFYLSKDIINKYHGIEPAATRVLSGGPMNWQMSRREIAQVRYDPTLKWGMGTIVHSGKIYIKNRNGSTPEFILLGVQDGSTIARELADFVSVQR